VRFDDIDIQIIISLIDTSCTTTDLAKMIFNPKTRTNLKAKNSLIYNRMKKLVDIDLIRYNSVNGTKHYILDIDKIIYGDSNVSINGTDITTGLALGIKTEKGKYILYFLD